MSKKMIRSLLALFFFVPLFTALIIGKDNAWAVNVYAIVYLSNMPTEATDATVTLFFIDPSGVYSGIYTSNAQTTPIYDPNQMRIVYSSFFAIAPSYWITTTAAKQGYYTCSASGNVGTGNAAITGFILAHDSSPPIIDEVSSSTQFSNSAFTVSWNAHDPVYPYSYPYHTTPSPGTGIQRYEIQIRDYLGATLVQDWTTLEANYTSKTMTFSSGQNGHTYYFRVRARDNNGNIGGWSGTVNTMVDTAKPASLITGPSGPINRLNPTITLLANDPLPGSGIANNKIEYKDQTPGYETGWSVFSSGQTLTNNHTYGFRSQATDRAGNVENAHPTADVTITINAGDPPRSLQRTSTDTDQTPTFIWQQPINGSDGYSYAIDSDPDETSDTDQTNYTSPILADGTHIFYVRSRKLDVGTSTYIWSGSIAVSFSIDTQSPTVSLAPVSQNGNYISVLGTANDAVGVKSVKYRILSSGGSEVKDWTAIPGIAGGTSEDFAISQSLADGIYTVFVKASDAVGHETNPAAETSQFIVDISAPTIKMKVGNKAILSSSIDPLIADPKPHIEADIADGNGIDVATLEIENADGSFSEEKTINVNGALSYQLLYDTSKDLNEGVYSVRVSCISGQKNSDISALIKVFSGKLEVLADPFNYPNPFKPGTSGGTTIKYVLSRNSDIKFIIYNVAGKPVKTYGFSAGENGGVAGDNLIAWDGKDNFGKTVANGPYYYYLIVDGKVIGRGEMAAFK